MVATRAVSYLLTDMTPLMPSPRPNPPRRLLFAVWRWKWWTWLAFVPLMAVAYFLSEPPVMLLLLATSGTDGPPTRAAITFYYPALWSVERCGTLAAIWDWEWSVIDPHEMTHPGKSPLPE